MYGFIAVRVRNEGCQMFSAACPTDRVDGVWGVDDRSWVWVLLLPICRLPVGAVRMFRQQKKDRAEDGCDR